MTPLRHLGMIERAVIMNKALADPQRMKIMKMLGTTDGQTLRVSDIAQILGISQPSATSHLKILRDAGFISREKNGTSVYYTIDQTGLNEYRQVLDCGFLAQTTPCPAEFQCDTCPAKSTCNTDYQWQD